MKRFYNVIDKLLEYAKCNLMLKERNIDYVRNNIFALFGLDSYQEEGHFSVSDTRPDELLKELKDLGLELGLIHEGEEEYYLDQVMGMLSIMPSEVDEEFYRIYKEEGSSEATEWFYNYCVKNDYVKKSKLDLNPRFDSNGLVITINKAKPEFRDPKKAQSGNATKGGYPKCSICHANEGFAGRNKKTLRTVNIELNCQKWFWQFSPYGYFYQHGITVNYEHTPMHVDRETFSRLMDFVDMFPHYFIGSNAALPRIGGSVLAHDHYQGGGEILPMHKAKGLMNLYSKDFTDAFVEIVDWPGTVVRIVSKNRDSIVAIGDMIRDKWVHYDNKELGIISEDQDGVHSAVSPTCVKTSRGYEMSIIFRNNITTEEFPDGVFHAHPEFHMIKKESIGLIEAQGLFILPGRLERQFNEIKELIHGGKPLTEELKDFKLPYDEIVALCNGDTSLSNVEECIKRELGSVCYRILENTAVFKDRKYTIKFMEDLGFICK